MLRSEILKLVLQYGTGRDTLRCLALGVIDEPGDRSNLDMENSSKFIDYEQNITFVVTLNFSNIFFIRSLL